MKVQGIILDETNLAEIRANGFTNFREINGEMHYEDEEGYQEWCCKQEEKLDNFSSEYMAGQCNASLFYFSDKPHVQAMIKSLFPACTMVTVDHLDYPLDYDYIRDKNYRPWI